MPIKRRVRRPQIHLAPVDELIRVRRQQHGGKQGAPRKINGEREGAAINSSCIIMISALLQGYIEEVFLYCSRRSLRNLRHNEALEKYRDSIRQWGNPNSGNIKRLFLRLGIVDPFEGLSWQKCTYGNVIQKLDEINTLRNQIAHSGHPDEPISLLQVSNLRNFVGQFGGRFAEHVAAKCPGVRATH